MSDILTGPASSDKNAPAGAQRNEHYALDLGYLPKFNPEHLTVLNNLGWKHISDLRSNAPSSGLVLQGYDQIVSINGVPETDFNDARDAMAAATTPGSDGRVKIEFYSMLKDTTYWASYVPKDITTYGQDESDYIADGAVSFVKARFNYAVGPECEILVDKSVQDWSRYRRIAFLPISNDPLKEKSFFEIVVENLFLSGFPFIPVALEDNPDLIVTLAFDEDSQVERTYVPPTTHYLESGSNATVTAGKNRLYVNSFRMPQRRVTSGGFTHREYDVNHFLEVTVLDARKMSDSTQTVPPVLWQLRYHKNFERPYRLKDAAYKVFKGLSAFPGTAPFVDPILSWNGICWDSKKSVITYIYSDSPAERLGLQVGDEIISIDGKKDIRILQQAWQNHRRHLDPRIHETFKFKNGWYNMIHNDRIELFMDFEKQLPDVDVYGNGEDQYFDDTTYYFEPDIFRPDSNHLIEIKRNGKKMKLSGILYEKSYFFNPTLNIPKYD